MLRWTYIHVEVVALESDVGLWKVFKIGDTAMLLNLLWGSSIDDDEDAEEVRGYFDWVERQHGNVKIVFPLPKNHAINEEEKEGIFQLILEALKNTPKRHFFEGDIMEIYELPPETARRLTSYFKKFTSEPATQYWW